MSRHNPFDVGRYLLSCPKPDLSKNWDLKIVREPTEPDPCPHCLTYKAQIVEFQARELILLELIPISHYEADDRHNSTMPVEFSYI